MECLYCKDCHPEGSAKVLWLNTDQYWVPQERNVMHLAEPKLKRDILHYNWTPKPTTPTVDAE